MSGFELGTDGPTSILVAVDGSRTSLRAGAYAAGLARRQSAQLVVVHVVTVSGLTGLSAEVGSSYQQSQRQVAAELEAEMLAQLPHSGLDRAEFVSLTGHAYDVIVRTAEERRVDAVVVGASEGTGHRFVGSLATRLVKAAKWPVTVVP